ncbi:MAG: DUF2062 domain-containing protein [Nitrospirota bacterium]
MALRDKLRLIFSVNESPRRVALAFAVGVFIGMSPLLGAHTILGFIAATLLRLNMLVTMAGVYVTNPWTIIPIYTFCTWVGAKCLGINDIIPDIEWSGVTFLSLIGKLSPMLKPFILGTILIGTLSSLTAYFVIHYLLKRKK